MNEDQATRAAQCLMAMARRMGVGDVAALNPELVLQEVVADPHHELREYYEWDESKAARAYWLQRTKDLIRGIRVVRLEIRDGQERTTTRPMFVTCDVPIRRGMAPERMRVLRNDALQSDPIFASACSMNVRRVHDALRQLEHLVGDGNADAHMMRFVAGLRGVFGEYESRREAAAE